MGDSGKKQVPLRLSAKLYDAIAAWAEDDFRSVNGQIEYLLTECVRQRKKKSSKLDYEIRFANSEHPDQFPVTQETDTHVSDEIDVPPELDIK